MTDYTQDSEFEALLEGTRGITGSLADRNVVDAQMLVRRSQGWHNLQGHARSIVPLAIWFIRQHPGVLCTIRANTNLNTMMNNASRESRGTFWDEVKVALATSLQQNGGDRIISGLQANSPETATEVATTYISDDYGGGQTTGGGGTTVLKRTLKLLAHTLPLDCQ